VAENRPGLESPKPMYLHPAHPSDPAAPDAEQLPRQHAAPAPQGPRKRLRLPRRPAVCRRTDS